jgi:CheY-like chemotaxis protein
MKMLNWFDGYLYKPFKKHKITELLESELRNQSEELEELELADDEEVMALSRPEKPVASELKILVAEDHPVNRKLLETFVKKTGADVYLAEDGQQAVQAVRENKDIDLIFMDIQMPVMNGIEATVELRKDGYNGIIIACTANNDSTDFDSYISSGINDIIVKPFKSDTIKNILEKWSTVMETANLASITNINVEINKESAWDKQSFTETVAGDMALAESIINSFIEQTDKIIADAKKAIGECDFTELRAASHSLCGSSGTISATKLAEYAKRLNQSAKAEDIASCNFDLNEFEHEYEVFKSLSKDYLEKK